MAAAPGPGLPSTFGGEVRTDAMDRICAEGVSYNRFHATAMCSPTRASLLTGRNHHEIGNGQIAELANDWDGYSGHIPRSSALMAEVLGDYGYSTAAFGKWHNTPAEETTAAGPFENWPAGLGFEYFYGFLAGEASQYEPNLVRNTTVVLPPKTPEEGYHLSEDLADDAIGWLRNHKALQADKPFFMYWASGCLRGPHHIMKEWADKYAGKFDDGWDAYRERVFERAKETGWIPQDCVLTERGATLASWDRIPEDEKPFQRRLMAVAAGYAEHVDVQVGRLVDELARLGYADNTLFFYIWGDDGSSGEGQNGTIAELLAQNNIPTTVRQHIDALDQLGGLDVLGSPLVDNQYHAGWGWAGVTPYKGMKLLASHLGAPATRWPSGGPGRSRRTRCRAISSSTATTSCPPSTRSSASSRRWWSTAYPRFRSPGRVSRALSLTGRRTGVRRPVFRDHGQPGDLSRGLDGIGVRPPRAVAGRGPSWYRHLDTRQRPLGALPPRRRLVSGPRPGRRDARETCADTMDPARDGPPRPGRRPQLNSDRANALCAATQRPAKRRGKAPTTAGL
jgi:arylsulfatase A-like enzyme